MRNLRYLAFLIFLLPNFLNQAIAADFRMPHSAQNQSVHKQRTKKHKASKVILLQNKIHKQLSAPTIDDEPLPLIGDSVVLTAFLMIVVAMGLAAVVTAMVTSLLWVWGIGLALLLGALLAAILID